jgi:hypothetical protein
LAKFIIGITDWRQRDSRNADDMLALLRR